MSENLIKEKEDGLDDLFKLVPINEQESEYIAAQPYSYWKSVFRAFSKRPAAIVSVVSFLILFLGVVIIPLCCPEGWLDGVVMFEYSNFGPSLKHWWGNDAIGRDLFFLTWTGARASLILAMISSLIVLFIGTIFGLIWGYFKKLDPLFIELYNLIVNIPSLLIYMLLSTILVNSFPSLPVEGKLIISLTLTSWVGLAYFIRNQVLIIQNREYNVASITLGTLPSRIMVKNYLPFLLAVIVTQFALIIPGMVSGEVSLSYFGVGLPKDYISLGAILDMGRKSFPQYWWQLLSPTILLALIIFVFFLFGITFADALDPKRHR